jgi:hypothetical protein
MITFFGAIIFATVIAIGTLDRNSGLRLLQKYESPWRANFRPPRPKAFKSARRRRARDT